SIKISATPYKIPLDICTNASALVTSNFVLFLLFLLTTNSPEIDHKSTDRHMLSSVLSSGKSWLFHDGLQEDSFALSKKNSALNCRDSGVQVSRDTFTCRQFS